jgi:hypothetical protein
MSLVIPPMHTIREYRIGGMIMSSCKHFLNILKETKELQEAYYHFMTSNSVPGKMGEDTIPFLLVIGEDLNEPFAASGFLYRSCEQKVIEFKTPFFRIEEVNEETCCVTISLLLPFDMDRYIAHSICDIYRLERTSCCLTIDLKKICGIQFADPCLINRKWPVIEPKW